MCQIKVVPCGSIRDLDFYPQFLLLDVFIAFQGLSLVRLNLLTFKSVVHKKAQCERCSSTNILVSPWHLHRCKRPVQSWPFPCKVKQVSRTWADLHASHFVQYKIQNSSCLHWQCCDFPGNNITKSWSHSKMPFLEGSYCGHEIQWACDGFCFRDKALWKHNCSTFLLFSTL